MLFSERSLWTMIHGIALGGGALLALGAALFALYLLHARGERAPGVRDGSKPVAMMTTFAAVSLWLTALVGTYVVFPPYRAAPPEGTTALAQYPRSFLLSDPTTVWLHAFAMETKEHLPFIAAMLATAVAFVAWRYRSALLHDRVLHRAGNLMLGTCFAVVAYVSLLGVFINKVAPVE